MRNTPLTQVAVETEIMRISDLMEEATEELATWADEQAEARHAYEVKHAQALLQAGYDAEGKITVGDKEAKAVLRSEGELRSKLITEARYMTAKAKLSTMQSRLDALRTVSANIRAQT